MRKLLVLVLAAGSLASTVLVIVIINCPRLQKRCEPGTANLPAEQDIARMSASLVESEVGFSATPEFVVPREHIGAILSWLRPGECAPNPPILPNDLLGKVKIVESNGRELVIKFYWAGKNPAVFTLNGRDYYWGGSGMHGEDSDGGVRLGKAIRTAYEASHEGKTP